MFPKEFKVTVDLENFKEIRIPFDLWKKIITRNYDPDGKFPLVSNIKENNITNKEDPTGIPSTYMSSQILHEVVLNVIVPPEAELLEDGTAVKPAVDGAVDLEISTEEVIIPVLQEEAAIAQDVLEVPVSSAQVVQAAPAGQAAQAVPTGQATGASPLAADSPASSIGGGPGSVLVQTARFPCACEGGICGCCTSFFQQKGCANIGFLPDEFAFEVKMTMNGNVLAKRKLPGKFLHISVNIILKCEMFMTHSSPTVSDPPPICFNPRRAPFLELCAQLNNIRLKNRNVHVCVDIDANVGGFELFSWNYSCLK